jgi:hypothetical protein
VNDDEVTLAKIWHMCLLIGLGRPKPDDLTPGEEEVWESLSKEAAWAKEHGYTWDVPFT